MEFVYFYLTSTSNFMYYLVFFIGKSVNSDSVLCLILAFFNGAIIFFLSCVSFSYLSSERIFSNIYFILELLIVYIYPWMLGALKLNSILHVKEVWDSVYSIVSNLYIDSDISIAAENCPEKHTKPDSDQKEKASFNWKETCAIFVIGSGCAFVVIGLLVFFTQK